MKKYFLTLIIILLAIPLINAADLKVSQIEKQNVIIKELDNNATFTLSIKNNEDAGDYFRIYSLIGAAIFPKEPFYISSGSEKLLEILINPHRETIRDIEGFYSFEYQIKGERTGYFKDDLTIKIIGLNKTFHIRLEDITIDSKEARLRINNLEKINLEKVSFKIPSQFFDFSETLDFTSEEEKAFTIPIKSSIIDEGITAGEYEAKVLLSINEKEAQQVISFNYLEKGEIVSSSSSEGFIVRKTEITKSNKGNIPVLTSINIRKNALTRLFTTSSEKPTNVERKGLFVDYSWEKEIGVGESETITVKTNYTIPFILLIIIIVAGIGAKLSIAKKVSLKKRVSLVKTKGGEFALRIKLRIKAKKRVTNLIISDRLPRMTKLYDKAGFKPTKIDEKNNKLIWEIGNLNSGEERVFTYIIYSKINIVGNFELPLASASYILDGETQHIFSNKTSFASETSESD